MSPLELLEPLFNVWANESNKIYKPRRLLGLLGSAVTESWSSILPSTQVVQYGALDVPTDSNRSNR